MEKIKLITLTLYVKKMSKFLPCISLLKYNKKKENIDFYENLFLKILIILCFIYLVEFLLFYKVYIKFVV